MPTGSLTETMRIAEIMLVGELKRTEDGIIGHQPSLSAGTAGTLTTRTGDDEGVATLEAEHGLQVNDMTNIFWVGGIRYGLKVTGVDGNAITFGGVGGPGAGDVLPAQGTALVMTKRVVLDTDFDGDLLEMIGAVSDKRVHLEFTEEGGTSLLALELTAGELWSWVKNTGIGNPLTGNPVGKVQVSNGETTTAMFKLALLYNSAE